MISRVNAFLERHAALSIVPPIPTPITIGGQGFAPAFFTVSILSILLCVFTLWLNLFIGALTGLATIFAAFIFAFPKFFIIVPPAKTAVVGEFNASFNTQLVEHLLQPTRDLNKFDVTFKIPVQVRKHKKKRINKKWLKKYGVKMVEHTIKNARLEHNYITNL